MTELVECESMNVSYNEMGIATVTYTVITDSEAIPLVVQADSIQVGNRIFNGYVTNLYQQPIPKTEGWYTTNVTMVATSP